jgi:hypothetical protein
MNFNRFLIFLMTRMGLLLLLLGGGSVVWFYKGERVGTFICLSLVVIIVILFYLYFLEIDKGEAEDPDKVALFKLFGSPAFASPLSLCLMIVCFLVFGILSFYWRYTFAALFCLFVTVLFFSLIIALDAEQS